jgi:NAD(P)H-dependent FMN reductase
MNLLVIVASTRPGRVGPQVADWFVERLPAGSPFVIDVADLAAINLPFYDEPQHPGEGVYVHQHTQAWSARVARADAVVLVMPEYNTGYTAPLKNALDFLLLEWRHKPVGFVSYGMTSGGMRAVELIKPVLVALGMVPVHEAVTVHLRQCLDHDGWLVPTAAMERAAETVYREVAALALPLRAHRMSRTEGAVA